MMTISSEASSTAQTTLLELLRTMGGRDIAQDVDLGVLQDLVQLTVKAYATKVQLSEGLEIQGPVKDNALNATDVAIFVDQLLKVVGMELFEVQIWRNLGSGY